MTKLEQEVRSLRLQVRLLYVGITFTMLAAAGRPERAILARSPDGKSEVSVQANDDGAEIRLNREGHEVVIWSATGLDSGVAIQGVRNPDFMDAWVTTDKTGNWFSVNADGAALRQGWADPNAPPEPTDQP